MADSSIESETLLRCCMSALTTPATGALGVYQLAAPCFKAGLRTEPG